MEKQVFTGELAAEALPGRRPDGHKGDFGRVSITGGSVGFTGAPVLAAYGAARSGSGLVFLGVPEPIYGIVASHCLEVMPSPLPAGRERISKDAFFPILERLNSCDAGLLGPGLGRSPELSKLMCKIMEETETPLILDADGLYAITDKGRKNGAVCESSLPYSVRTKCSRRLSKVNAALRRDAQVRSEILPRADGTCTLRLSLDDEEGNILTLELLSPSQAQSERLAEGFKARPEQIYNGVLDVLLAEADNADNKEREP